MRPTAILLSVLALLAGLLAAVSPASAAPRGGGIEVYVGNLTPAQVEGLGARGLDHEDVAVGRLRDGRVPVEIVMPELLADRLLGEGYDLTVKRVDGKKASTFLAEQARSGYEVYRPYTGPGGIRAELQTTVAEFPGLTRLVNIGTTLQDKPIFAVKVTKNAKQVRDGARPAVMYGATQHAREWITTEMTRRLLHHVLEGYGTDERITELVDTTELWFVPVQNPDGYDYTFTEGNRLWRKNLRDNNADGTVTTSDGVDLNRNSATKWGWDNEGSSPEISSQTYRGAGAASEPETQAMDRLFGRVGFEFFINYHSAAELLLYGIGWQVSTPSPDDVIYEAMVGTDEDPAVPGYDPDISAELYTTNGDIDTHMQVAHRALGFTPEMTTCEVASNVDPDDEWVADDCASGFNFPDDEALIQAEFEKNIPFALATAESTHDPEDPVSVVGLDAADLVADPFAVSHGTTQPVAVTAKRSLSDKTLHYRVDGGAEVTAPVALWDGGERYGDTHHDYYGEFRGTVAGTAPGDSVEVWFSGANPGGETVQTEPFTYKVADDIGGDVLVLAAEDVTGVSPAQGVTSAKYADEYVAAVEAAGHSADVYDVDANARTAPHHLGVLSHYNAVVWETGDDIITREVGQPGGTAAELALDLELSVRDYLNEGGKLLHTGKYANHASATNGSYWYNPFEEEQGECTVRAYPCLQLLNDFTQYWLGAYEYIDNGGTDPDGNPYAVTGTDGAFEGFEGTFNGGDSANNQNHTASFLPTSGFLPPDEFPQFTSGVALDWLREGAAPYDPYTGDWYLFSGRDDVSWKRLTRTVDLTGASTGNLTFQTSYSTEADWDYLVVEAHTVGQDDWTTLPDANGHTGQGTGDSCPEGWDEIHPFITHYQTPDSCGPTGTTGSWNAATGGSNGWQQWSVDLSGYAGEQVEVSISYISDWGTQGLGVFLDDVAVTVDAQTAQTSFEDGLGGWSVAGAPAGSGTNDNDWSRSQKAFEEGAAVTTEDTVYTGFGAEGLTTQEMRHDLVARSLQHLLGG